MIDDASLLREYAESRSEGAFAELVRRNIDLVHAAALRQCQGNAALAQDVTQQVFCDLARRAGKLCNHPALVGWLHTATRFTSMNLLRGERRRLAREQEAALRAPNDAGASPDWEALGPVIDAALGELKERDRAAVLLRFFEGKSLQEVGERLALSESAARSCVDRALEKVRVALARRGVTSAAGALAAALTEHATVAAPAGLAASVTTAALSATGATGAAVASIFAMKYLVWISAGLLLVAGIATTRWELKERHALSKTLQGMQRSPDGPSTAASGALTAVAKSGAHAGSGADVRAGGIEVNRLRERASRLQSRPPGVVEAAMTAPERRGRKTPRDAKETLSWAIRNRDTKLLESFLTFGDDTPENRAEFMKDFGPAVEARYPTPEALLVAINFAESLRDPPVAEQILEVQSDALGIQRVTAWSRYASGREARTTLPFQETDGGWCLTAVWLTGPKSPRAWLRSRLDLATGEVQPVTPTP